MSAQIKETVLLSRSYNIESRADPIWTLQALKEEDELGHIYWLVLQTSMDDNAPRFATPYHNEQAVKLGFVALLDVLDTMTTVSPHLGMWTQDVELERQDDTHKRGHRKDYASASARSQDGLATCKSYTLELSERRNAWHMTMTDTISGHHWQTAYSSAYLAAISYESLYRSLRIILYKTKLAAARNLI